MPMRTETINEVLNYCKKDLTKKRHVATYFDFLGEPDLERALVKEYYAARYIYKLGEAISAQNEDLAAHAKFQIVQYASIYEAIISHLLWGRYKDHAAVKKIEEYKSLKRVGTLPRVLKFSNPGDQGDVYVCKRVTETNTPHAIKFQNKISAAVKIGFLDKNMGGDIKNIFSLRNGVHIENAVKNEIEYEIKMSKLAYWRMKPFCLGVSEFIKTGVLPETSKVLSAGEIQDIHMARNSSAKVNAPD